MFFVGTLIVYASKRLLEIFDRIAPGVKIVKVNSDKIEAFWGVSLKSKHPCDLGILKVVFSFGVNIQTSKELIYLLLLEVAGKCM